MDFSRAEKRGFDNLECIKGMQSWCAHFEIKQMTSGLYAEILNLPIASHKIGCPMVEGGSQSMNLRWICSDFLKDHCDCCKDHKPNGDTTWGRELLDKIKSVEQKSEQAAKVREKATIDLRAKFRAEAESISDNAKPELHRIVEFLEQLFSNDNEQRQLAAVKLQQSAQLAPELFSESAINLIFHIAEEATFAPVVLPICSKFSMFRHDLSSRLEQIGISNIRNNVQPESSAEVINNLNNLIQYPLTDDVIESLVFSQNHYTPIGGWNNEEPTYRNSTSILLKSFDADQEHFLNLFRRFLIDEDDHKRFATAGAILLAQSERSAITKDLISGLLASLEFVNESWSTVETASGKVVHVLQNHFRISPQKTDQILCESMRRAREEVQKNIISVYRDQFFDRTNSFLDFKDRKNREEISDAELIAIQRLFVWIKDDTLQLDIRVKAAEALSIACNYATEGIRSHLDSLLGYYAILCGKSDPPAPPRNIVLPGQPEEALDNNLRTYARSQDWRLLKHELKNCLEGIAENRPTLVFELISGFLDKQYAILNEDFKSGCILLLGKIGRDYHLQPNVLPYLMRALMDYESVWIRTKGIEATLESFQYSKSGPPLNIVDSHIVHLRDQYVSVHKAALRTVSWKPYWFNEEQCIEILGILQAHAKVYRKDPYQLDDITDAIFSIARQVPQYLNFSLEIVCRFFPTGEHLVDDKIAEEMIRTFQASDPLAPNVASQLAKILAEQDRDQYNSYERSRRSRFFEWLHELTPNNYQAVASELLISAKKLAQSDPWEALHFASLFSTHREFDKEVAVLNQAINSQIDEPRTESLRRALGKIACLAKANLSLQSGDTVAANASMAEIYRFEELDDD